MRTLRTAIVASAAALLVAGGAAGAATLITGKDVKNGSLTGADIKKSSITLNRLSPGTRALIHRVGKQGVKGDSGAQGPIGPTGAAGSHGKDGANGVPGTDGKDATTQVSALSSDPTSTDFYARSAADCSTPDPGHPLVNIAPAPEATTGSDALKFGPFTDGTAFGEVRTAKFDGIKLKNIQQLRYSARYDGGSGPGAAPYMFINTSAGLVSFTPADNTTPEGDAPTEGRWQTWDVRNGMVSYDDTAGGSPMTWSELIATHGEETIESTENGGGFRILAGCAGDGSSSSTSYADNLRVEIGGQKLVFDFEN
jgi:hypothetical protein